MVCGSGKKALSWLLRAPGTKTPGKPWPLGFCFFTHRRKSLDLVSATLKGSWLSLLHHPLTPWQSLLESEKEKGCVIEKKEESNSDHLDFYRAMRFMVRDTVQPTHFQLPRHSRFVRGSVKGCQSHFTYGLSFWLSMHTHIHTHNIIIII